MKNLKTKIKTIIIGTLFAIILSGFFVANLSYAAAAGAASGLDSTPSTTTPAAPGVSTPNNKDLTEGTFNVQKNLTLDNGDQPKKYFNDSSGNSPIVSLAITIIDFAITIMGSIAVVLIIVAGFVFMSANGQSTKLDEAKDIIKYAAIGLIVALLSYVITIFVQSIFSNG